uniref:Interleukin-4 n=1 Tax=Sciurus vulgaris TaxID=55149 RepID=A0A8D2DP43_SCIVU
MGLTPQLIATLCCLLVCSGDFTHGYDVTLEEIIKTLNTLSGKKTSPCHFLLGNSGKFSSHNCPMSESKQRPLKDFLESLRSTMQKKYSECGRSMF